LEVNLVFLIGILRRSRWRGNSSDDKLLKVDEGEGDDDDDDSENMQCWNVEEAGG
jgi:hypothetical protein